MLPTFGRRSKLVLRKLTAARKAPSLPNSSVTKTIRRSPPRRAVRNIDHFQQIMQRITMASATVDEKVACQRLLHSLPASWEGIRLFWSVKADSEQTLTKLYALLRSEAIRREDGSCNHPQERPRDRRYFQLRPRQGHHIREMVHKKQDLHRKPLHLIPRTSRTRSPSTWYFRIQPTTWPYVTRNPPPRSHTMTSSSFCRKCSEAPSLFFDADTIFYSQNIYHPGRQLKKS